MLESVTLKNFTVFSEADFKFATGLNVIVGENGAGKTHVLKVAYSAVYVSANGNKQSVSANPTKAQLQTAVASKLNATNSDQKLVSLAISTACSCSIGCLKEEERKCHANYRSMPPSVRCISSSKGWFQERS